MAAPPPPPPRGGMSLYANLLDPKGDSSGPASRAPMVFKRAGEGGDGKDEGVGKKSLDAAAIQALRFQPIRRPQVKQPSKAKPSFPKAIPGAGTAGTASNTAGGAPASKAPRITTLADWTATEEDELLLYGTGEKRQRGGRKNKRRKRNRDERQQETDWDELYDPARPTNVDEYLRSAERVAEVREWKAILYAHRTREASDDSEMESDGEGDGVRNNRFAPPANYSFAPPPEPLPGGDRRSGSADGRGVPRGPSTLPDDATGDDAYARRLAMSSNNVAIRSPPPDSPFMPADGAESPPPARSPTPPPPPAPPAQAPPTHAATIIRAPVRYDPPPPESPSSPSPDDMEIDVDIDPSDDYSPPPPEGGASDSDPSAPRSKRPGQAGFAERLMSKFGWTKGSGLGADESGIVAPLRVQVEKRRKRPDAEGGGFAERGGRGRIVGGKKKKRADGDEGAEEDEGFGRMSEVVVLRGMLEGMDDLRGEIEGGLGQEIGEECGEKYGRVERLYIDVEDRQVFIKFTDQVSALRAVNALQGRIFSGNTIVPKFYDSEKFEKGVYR